VAVPGDTKKLLYLGHLFQSRNLRRWHRRAAFPKQANSYDAVAGDGRLSKATRRNASSNAAPTATRKIEPWLNGTATAGGLPSLGSVSYGRSGSRSGWPALFKRYLVVRQSAAFGSLALGFGLGGWRVRSLADAVSRTNAADRSNHWLVSYGRISACEGETLYSADQCCAC
jgi:hypothetical protein